MNPEDLINSDNNTQKSCFSASALQELVCMLFEVSTDAIALFDHQGQILRLNRIFKQIWGLNEDWTNTCFDHRKIDFLSSQLINAADFAQKAAKAINEKPQELFWMSEFQDGRLLECYSRSLKCDEGKSLTLLVFRDTTALMQTERELRKNRLQLLVTQKIAHLGTWEYDPENQTMNLSDEARRITGIESAGSIVSFDQYLKTIFPNDVPALMNCVERAINAGIPYETELRHVIAEGSYNYVLTRGQPLARPGKQPQILGTIFDITDLKVAEEALRKSEHQLQDLNNTKDKFFSIISHDLKNLFTVLIGTSEFLVDSYDNLQADKIKGFVQSIHRATSNSFTLLGNLLNWARSQTGAIELRLERVNLKEIVHDTIELMSNIAQNKKIRCVGTVPDDTLVLADANMIKTVIRNLVSNAIKFTDAGGYITVNAKPSGDFVSVIVQDNGIGMNAETMESLFKLGAQKTSIGTAREKGTGLGLILCKDFVEKNAGWIWAESVPGKGSTFTFMLPRAQAMEAKPSDTGRTTRISKSDTRRLDTGAQ